MQKRKLIFLLFIVIQLNILPSSLLGQFYVEDKPIYDEAEMLLDGEEYEEALPLFTLLESKGIINSNISYKIGLCLFKTEDKKAKAIPYLESAAANITNNYSNEFSTVDAPIDALFLLGISYRVNYQFEKSIDAFSRVKKHTSDSALYQLADYYIAQCRIAQSFLKYPSSADIQVFDDKGQFSVYNPVVPDIKKGNIFFMQRRKFYDAVIKSGLNSTYPPELENITPAIGSDGDIKLSSISPDTKTMVLSAYEAGNGFEIYYAKSDSLGEWGNYTKYPAPINSPSNETGASLTADGRKLYFCSNRPGGTGAYDIYKTELLPDGSWSLPQNLGKTINTSLNDISPYISGDGNMLYFCSEGYLNMGGYDIFSSKLNELGGWTHPINMGSPVSTPGDDMFISTSNDKNILYTYRLNTKTDNRNKIYKISLNKNTTESSLLLTGKLIFSDSIPAKAVVYNIIDNSNNETKQISETSSDGSFDMFLPAGSFKLNFLYNNDITASQSVLVLPDQPIDQLTIEAPIWIIQKQEPLYTLLLRDVLYDFDSYKLPASYSSMLDSIADIQLKYSDIYLNIAGYTDAVGSNSYNLKLSQKRANAVKSYLLAKGVSGDRIITSGKGEDNPVAVNSNSDGSDNSSGRKFNRRVTIEMQFNNDKIVVKKIIEVPKELIIR